MTAAVETPPTERHVQRDTPSRRTDAARARWRVAARLAQRQLRRTALSSVLIATLILLPIAAMTAYAIISVSTIGTAAERNTVELGRTQAWLAVRGLPGQGFWQAPSEPDWNGYPASATQIQRVSPVSDPTPLLPAGTETIRVVETDVRVATPDGVTGMRVWSGGVWDQRFEGRFDAVEGRSPNGDTEIMATPATLERLDIALGDEIVLPDVGATYTVVGTMEAATLPSDESALFLPSDAPIDGDVRWYLPDFAPSWTEIEALNEDGVVAYSRPVVLDPPFIDANRVQGSYDRYSGATWNVVMVLAAGGLFAAYVVVMLAGAAFAVSARRQQRSLAVAASVGASAGDLRRVILFQGTLLGLVGGLAGLALGIGAAAVTMTLIDDGSAIQFWGFHIPWFALGAIAVFSLLVGTAAATMPARTIARSDVIHALRGARRPQVPRAARPIWGSVLMIVGVALTIGSAFVVLAVNTLELPGESPLRAIAPLGIVIGPIVVQLGILLSGRWLLWVTSKALSRIGLAARLAGRDAAANAARTVPAFAAIAATVFLAVFSIAQTSMQLAQTSRDWTYQAPVGTLSFGFYPTDDAPQLAASDAADAATAALELADAAGAERTAVVSRQPEFLAYNDPTAIPADATKVMAVVPTRNLLDPVTSPSWTGSDPSNPISVIAADDIGTALGVELSAAQKNSYADGAAIVTDSRYVTKGTVSLAAWNARDANSDRTPDNIWTRRVNAPPLAEPLWERDLAVIDIDLPRQPIAVAVSPETAAELGLDSRPERVIASFASPPPVEVRDRVQADASFADGSNWTIAPSFEDGPPDDAFWMVPILAAVSVLVLGASGVALSLARLERRPDDATLSAIGGTDALRRRIGFWQGLIIAGFGTVAGAVAGILPPIGFAIQSQGTLQLSDLPWLVLAALAVALPLAIAAVSWLIPPRRADLIRRTAIA